MNSLITLSIITVCKNVENTIEKTILSVVNQTYNSFEYIIIDGLSTDNTLNIISKYRNKIKLIREKDSGIYDAMNKGIHNAKGKWIYFLGADDILFNDNIIEKISTNFNSELHFIYGNVIFEKSKLIYDGFFDKEKLVKKNICHQAIFYKKELFDKKGNFNTDYKFVADYDFNLRVWADRRTKILYLDIIIAIFNENGFSSTQIDKVFYKKKNELLLEYNYVSQYTLDYIKEKFYKIHNSKEYKLGNFILSPFKRIKLLLLRLFYKR